MSEILQHIWESTQSLAVEGIVALAITLITLLISFAPRNSKSQKIAWSITLLAFLSCLFCTFLGNISDQSYFFDLLRPDPVSRFGSLLVFISGIIILLHIRLMKYNFDAEAYLLILGISVGIVLLLKSSHFLSFFISLEFISICSYLLVAFEKGSKNLEAGIKYLIFGATATAIMLYGISLLYGLTGNLDFASVNESLRLSQLQESRLQIVLALVLAGPLFKLAAAPFHIWAPDVYEATPTPFISFLAIAPKVGGLIAVYRVLSLSAMDNSALLGSVILLSILIGNFSALTQTDSKRMMGYSGIAQAGFILIGLLGLSHSGIQASAFYLGAYVFISTGAFYLLDMISRQTGSYSFESMAGLSQRYVMFGIIGLIFMVGLTGLPPTSGFTAKFLVFSQLWEQYASGGQKILIWVLVFGLINTAISIYYYFRIPYQMFVKRPQLIENKISGIPALQLSFLSLLAAMVIALFFAPQWVMNLISF